MKKRIIQIGIIGIATICLLTGCEGGKKTEEKQNIQNNTIINNQNKSENKTTDVKEEQNSKNNINNMSENNTEKDVNLKDIFLEVLDNKRNYKNEANKTVNIQSYLNQFDKKDTVKISYTMLDIDSNGDDELIALFENNGRIIFSITL